MVSELDCAPLQAELVRSGSKPPPVVGHILPLEHHPLRPLLRVDVGVGGFWTHRKAANEAIPPSANKAVEATPTKPLGFGYGSWLIGVGLVLHSFIVVRVTGLVGGSSATREVWPGTGRL